MLVTETMPMNLKPEESKTFTFKRMKDLQGSSTLRNHQFSLEFTSNPAWYAVQSLPYLMEYPYDCTEQIFNRYYANTLASSVANSNPKIKEVFEQWQNTDALASNLTKNEALKSLLLEETPWVLSAQSEAQQKKNIALLFDLNKMSEEQTAALETIISRQSANGGFSWFPGGRDSWFITQYIVEGLGHLKTLNLEPAEGSPQLQQMKERAIAFIDNELLKHYQELKKRVKQGKTEWENDHLGGLVIHYLYTRSFYKDLRWNENLQEPIEYYMGQAEKFWLKKGLYYQGLLALAINRFGKTNLPTTIIRSLKERALHHEELGMYWKYNRGYFWYQMPIETHALMIELFAEVAEDEEAVNDLKVWLLKNKQTTHWKTTKATAAAVYALLGHGSDWLAETAPLEIEIADGKKKFQGPIEEAKQTAEAGSGYFKANWSAAEVNEKLAKIKVENPNEVISWGAAYWQYFEDLDKITTFEETPLQLKKDLFKVVPTDTEPELVPLNEQSGLEPGDKLKVRIELRVDRDMEYVHMKDMRGSGLEPINVLSQYKWQDGLGYYESTGDVATNFFFSYLPKGTYVFEYPLSVNHRGIFSNGITQIQCMYAPEFSSHSEGIKVQVGQ